MSSCLEATITGFNTFLADQKKQTGMARFTLALFDYRYEVPYASVPIEEVTDLNTRTFVPRGSTALLDAVCRTIDQMGQRFAAQPVDDRAAQVIVAILTDGFENASHRFTWKDVSARIQHQTEVYKWVFLFLGANEDAIATAAKMNISAANSSSYVADAVGSHAVFSSKSRKLSALRKMSQGTATAADVQLSATPLSDLVAEDDRSERGDSKKGV